MPKFSYLLKFSYTLHVRGIFQFKWQFTPWGNAIDIYCGVNILNTEKHTKIWATGQNQTHSPRIFPAELAEAVAFGPDFP